MNVLRFIVFFLKLRPVRLLCPQRWMESPAGLPRQVRGLDWTKTEDQFDETATCTDLRTLEQTDPH